MGDRANLFNEAEENACGCGTDTVTEDVGCLCTTSDLVHVIGRKYSVFLLSLLADRKSVRFNEIKEELGEISSSTLSIRLSELEGAGLIQRQLFGEVPPRVEYSLTEGGEALRKSLLSLTRKAVRNGQ